MLPPSVQFKPVEGDSLATNADFADEGSNLRIEAISVHAEVEWGISQPEDTEPRNDNTAVSRVLRTSM